MSKRLVLLVACWAGAAMSGCVVGGAGGAGGGAALVGGAAGAVCDPNQVYQGCSNGQPVECDAATNSWKALTPCPQGTYCLESFQPGNPKPLYRTSSCATASTGGSDTSSTGGGDTSVAKDTSGQPDTSVQPDTTSGPDAVKDVAVVGDTTQPTNPLLVCTLAKCSGEYSACAAEGACASFIACASACSGIDCVATCAQSYSGNPKVSNLINCAIGAGCSDVGPVCGNGNCESGETKANCSVDCGSAGPVCGNGNCESGETKTNCSVDCGSPGPVCGNGACESGETTANCSQDCKTTVDCCKQNGLTCGYSSKCGKDCGKCSSTQTCTANKCVDNSGSCLDQYCASQWDACINDSKCVGIVAYVILNNCAETNSCQDNTCTQTYCSKEITQCQQEPGCVTFVNCLQGCTDQTCADKCVNSANGYLYDDFMTCAQTNCP